MFVGLLYYVSACLYGSIAFRATYRRLLFKILSPRGLRTQVRKYTVVLSTAVYLSRSPDARCWLEDWKLCDLSHHARTRGVVLRLFKRRALWLPPHQSLAVVHSVSILIVAVVVVGTKGICECAVCIVGHGVIGEEAPGCGGW